MGNRLLARVRPSPGALRGPAAPRAPVRHDRPADHGRRARLALLRRLPAFRHAPVRSALTVLRPRLRVLVPATGKLLGSVAQTIGPLFYTGAFFGSYRTLCGR